MPSSLPIFLQGEIDRIGKDAAWLSRKSGVDKSTLHNMMTEPNVVPRLATLDKLANALSIPLARLIRQVGFDLGNDEPMEQSERIAELLEAEPQLAGLLDELRQVSPDELRDFQVYVSGRRDLRRQRQTGPE